MNSLRAADIHARINWPTVLQRLGVLPEFLRDKHGPCPICGGKDRYRHDGKGFGRWICNQCGSGDGFLLLMKLHRWDFREAKRRVLEAADLQADDVSSVVSNRPTAPTQELALPTSRVLRLLRESCEPENSADVVDYLNSRGLWPLPFGNSLRAHTSCEYWHDRQRVGSFAALIASVRDIAGDLVTVHATHLSGGRKLKDHEPRKLLSPLTGRTGCAVRITPIRGDTLLGISEGIETALAAARLHDVPVWAALNTALLSKFEPPSTVRALIVFADRDAPGLEAAARLMERLQRRVHVELRLPPSPAKDFADALIDSNGR